MKTEQIIKAAELGNKFLAKQVDASLYQLKAGEKEELIVRTDERHRTGNRGRPAHYWKLTKKGRDRARRAKQKLEKDAAASA